MIKLVSQSSYNGPATGSIPSTASNPSTVNTSISGPSTHQVEIMTRVGDVNWASGSKPSDSEIISVYSSKSAYYDQGKVLQHVKHYPD